MRRSAVAQLAVLLGALCFSSGSHSQESAPRRPPRVTAPRGKSEFPVVDLHVDLPWQVHFRGRAIDMKEGHATVAALRRGHVMGLVLPIYLPDHVRPEGPNVSDADAVHSTITALLAAHDELLPLGSAAAQTGRISTWLAIEGAGAFTSDPPAIDRFIARGLRLVGLVHGKHNAFASSATDKTPVDYGLSQAGRAFAERVYTAGALIDVSHLSDRGFADLEPIARRHGAPIVATHSNARALVGHPRTLTDEQLAIIGASGGVAGLNLHASFVSRDPEPTMGAVVAQVNAMVASAGIEHVAIGSDFDGGIRTPKGLEGPADFPKLAKALLAGGLSERDVGRIFCLNALRVLAWRPGVQSWRTP